MPVSWSLRAYRAAAWVILPVALVRAAWRGRRHPEDRGRLHERLGYGERLPAGCLWVHAVSVGETRAAAPLVRHWLQTHPECPVLVTTTTFTGAEQVRMLFGGRVAHRFAPYDVQRVVDRFLDRTKPQAAVIFETELWPVLYGALAARRIPLMIANARLSERSFRGYRRIAGLMRQTLAVPQIIGAQGADDARRLKALGAPATAIEVIGNIKFDIEVAPGLETAGERLREAWGRQRPVWVAASTHAGEEEAALAAHRIVQRHCPGALLVLVPRHPERFDAVARLVDKEGLRKVRRSTGDPVLPDTDVLLGDTMGELMVFFAAADCAFIGGSLVPTGGHNPLEAMAVGRPVVFGPHMFNFEEIAGLALNAQAARAIPDGEALAPALLAYLTDATARQATGDRGLRVVRAQAGAAARTAALVERLLA
ncbi:MAG: lipid IV(A) 3-deoxy-D-manno-octulosonic acid transferase [Gammaproteobacteria bacterium]|nr:lipid IV(A) 3-deoxy-D-manno-octulosonic acid transferase [Gammaproteobacteria bacterium]